MEIFVKVEILGTFGGGYVVFDLEGQSAVDIFSSARNLRPYLKALGVTDQLIDGAIGDLQHPPRKVRLTS